MFSVEPVPIEIIAEQSETLDGISSRFVGHGLCHGKLAFEETGQSARPSRVARREERPSCFFDRWDVFVAACGAEERDRNEERAHYAIANPPTRAMALDAQRLHRPPFQHGATEFSIAIAVGGECKRSMTR